MKKTIFFIMILQLFLLACNKEETKIQDQAVQETSSTNTDPQFEKLRNNLKNGL